MATTALVASVAAPFSALADSDNIITSVPSIADDYENVDAPGGVVDFGAPVSTLILKEKNVAYEDGKVFRLTLPSGVKFVKDAYAATNTTLDDHSALIDTTNIVVTDQTLELTIDGTTAGTGTKDEIKVPLFIEVDGAEGDLKVTVDPNGTTINAGSYTFATVANGDTNTTVEEVKTIGETGTLASIRVDENSIGAVGNAKQTATFKLPSNFDWAGVPTIQFSGGFSGLTLAASAAAVADGQYFASVSENTLTLTFDPTAGRTQRGTIRIVNANISAEDNASYGDVELNVDGDEFTSQDITVAKYSDYSATIKADDEDVEEIFAGRDDSDNDDVELTELVFKEEVAGTLFTGRKTKVTLPSWVKVRDIDITDIKGFAAGTTEASFSHSIDKNEVEITLPAANSNTSKREFNIKFKVSVQANKSGDIEAKVSGRAGFEGTAVIGKAIAPVTAKSAATNVKVGVKNQAIGDIEIVESKKGAFLNGQTVTIVLPDNVEWNEEPKVEVVEGNLEIDEDSIDVTNETLSFDIDGESTKASKIKISGATIDLDRTIPEGVVEAEIGGSALVENDGTGANQFDTDYTTKVVVANVVTPAPGQVSNEVKFVIDNAAYTVNGVEKTADVAPFIQDGRTFLPVRFVAEAVGVTDSNIIYNANTKTVTLIKGDRIAQVQIGSKTLLVNGVSVQMDTAAAVKNGRTVLPLRFVAQALGADVQWDEATRTVTIK